MPTRTTLTLDDDVAAKLRRASLITGRPLKAIVNDALRTGLDARHAQPLAPFKVAASKLGLRPGMELDSISELIERVEGPEHR